jgi:hypothetical protein
MLYGNRLQIQPPVTDDPEISSMSDKKLQFLSLDNEISEV